MSTCTVCGQPATVIARSVRYRDVLAEWCDEHAREREAVIERFNALPTVEEVR